MRLAAPGPQLGAGRLRVDAARAIAKLREYQLANRAAWVLEAIRAAVASGATKIELTADSNDVWLAWDGEPWPADDLPNLLDELVSPDGERYAVRLLAAAVNSALGMAPVHVDVTSIGDSAVRARYTPAVLASADALHDVAAETLNEAPRGRGMLVHLRRRLTGSYFLGEPPELQLARDACRDLRVPLTIQGATLLVHHDVVRVPLGDTLTGFLAVVDPGTHVYRTVLVEVAEHGVLLTSYPLDLGPFSANAPLPIRLYIDAPRMPTNASRSQVRRDSFPIADAEARAADLIPALIAQLDDSPRGRAAALALVASQIAGPGWCDGAAMLKGPYRALADRPLLRDACGHPHPVTHAWRSEVHTGRSPLDPELASRLGHVPWIRPGEPEAALLGGTQPDQRELRRLVRWARQQVRAEKRFFTHAQRPARVSAQRRARIQVPLGVEVVESCIPQNVFAGMAGEVCVYGEPGHGDLVVLIYGRELERLSYDAQLGFEVVIDTERATPIDRYRGVARDAYFIAIERAMRAGVVRAVETLAGREDFGREPSDFQLVRAAMQLVRELGGMVRGPLARAAIWRTRQGERVSTAALREQLVVAMVSQREPWHVPPGRAAVIATPEERTQLSRLLGDRAVDYDRAGEPDEMLLAVHAMSSGRHALLIRHPGLVAAIGPATAPLLVLSHRGRELDRRGYTPSVMPCAISLDADAIVPDVLFRSVADAAGLRDRDFREWEIALVRAVARAALGQEVPDLRGVVEPGLDSTICRAIANADPIDVLGEDLVARLQDLPAAPLLGEPMPRTLRELAAQFPHTIPYVAPGSLPVDGFEAIVAADEVAIAIARLCGRGVHDGSGELDRRHREARYETRLAVHRAQPVRALELDGPYVGFETVLAKGVLGVSPSAFVIDVLVEGRPFVTLQGPDDLPLRAIVDLAVAHAGRLEALPEDTIDKLLRMLRRAIPKLIVAIAEKMPELIGDPGPARTLVARWLERGKADKELRDAISAARAFQTIQGGRVSLREAAEPLLVVSIATWQGEWVAALRDPDALDAPVVAITDGSRQVTTIVDTVHLGAVVDVTAEVGRLQARRRMARGLVPRPRVQGIAPAYVAKLEDLPSGKGLGSGEIGLADGDSLALLHVNGQPSRTAQLSFAPAIRIAIEESELPGAGRLQRLTAELVRRVLAATDHGALPGRLRRNLARGVLSGVLSPGDVGDTPLLEIAGGSWVPWGALAAQHDLYGDIWASTDVNLGFPLDPRRVVFRLDRPEIDLGRAQGLPLVDAASELRLDTIARRNMARTPEPALVLPSVHELAKIELDGDGITGPRGTVLPLLPGEHKRALVRVHRKMVALGEIRVDCDWPTAAVIDDARITLNRTLDGPVSDGVWDDIVAKIRTASERGVANLVPIPAGALASTRVVPGAYAGARAFHDPKRLAVRGAVWLVAQPPGAPVAIRVIHAHGERTFTPKRGISMAGTLYVHWTSEGVLDEALDELVTWLHGALLRQIIALANDLPADLVRAHLAHGQRLGRVVSTEVAHLDLREPPRAPDRPAPSHPVEPLVAAVMERLGDVGIHGVTWRIANRAEPIVAYDDMLVVAGDNARLLSLATSLDSPWFDGALDALTAHVVSVLNIALTEITDATELHALGKLLTRPSAVPPRSRQSS